MCTSTLTDAKASQRGETLLESLLAIAILGVLGVSLFAGFQVVIKETSGQQRDSTAETLLRSYAEQVQDPDTDYVPRAGSVCALGRTYAPPTLPAGSLFTASVTEVRFWKNPTADGVDEGLPVLPTPFYGDDPDNDPANYCPGDDAADGGLQKLQLTVTRPDGTSSSMSVLKRRR